MSFVRRSEERQALCFSKKMFGGDGEVNMHPILTGAGEMNGKGRLFSHVVLEPGCGLGWHIHNGDSETYYILSGHGEYSDNGNIVELYPGDAALVNDGEGHSIRNTGEEPLELIALILYT